MSRKRKRSSQPPHCGRVSLDYLRQQSAKRLKSTWDDIIKRYGRDLSKETDEIDLKTELVVIDRGVLKKAPALPFGGLPEISTGLSLPKEADHFKGSSSEEFVKLEEIEEYNSQKWIKSRFAKAVKVEYCEESGLEEYVKAERINDSILEELIKTKEPEEYSSDELIKALYETGSDEDSESEKEDANFPYEDSMLNRREEKDLFEDKIFQNDEADSDIQKKISGGKLFSDSLPADKIQNIKEADTEHSFKRKISPDHIQDDNNCSHEVENTLKKLLSTSPNYFMDFESPSKYGSHLFSDEANPNNQTTSDNCSLNKNLDDSYILLPSEDYSHRRKTSYIRSPSIACQIHATLNSHLGFSLDSTPCKSRITNVESQELNGDLNKNFKKNQSMELLNIPESYKPSPNLSPLLFPSIDFHIRSTSNNHLKDNFYKTPSKLHPTNFDRTPCIKSNANIVGFEKQGVESEKYLESSSNFGHPTLPYIGISYVPKDVAPNLPTPEAASSNQQVMTYNSLIPKEDSSISHMKENFFTHKLAHKEKTPYSLVSLNNSPIGITPSETSNDSAISLKELGPLETNKLKKTEPKEMIDFGDNLKAGLLTSKSTISKKFPIKRHLSKKKRFSKLKRTNLPESGSDLESIEWSDLEMVDKE
ncbi:hypothetical protein G9A89_011505 [Geosiphon pyriformis]|nr:hypothetical protein G9A89_011505 [Geosiphon pyriformis]